MEREIFSILLALVLVLSFSLVMAVPASANTDRLVPSQYATIQLAIDAASPGDTILVAAGTYNENVEVNKQLTLTGDLSQPGNVVVDAGGSDNAITLTAGDCVLQGFKAQNGEYGIYLDKSDNNTLTSNMADSNTEYGIYLDYSNNNTLTENTANSNTKCGIYLDNSSDNTLTENTISENNESGINLDGGDNNTLTSSYITGNNTGVKIQSSVDASTISINFNNIYGNTNYGVDNTGGTSAVDAKNNWWGYASGPTHAGNPGGTGDAVSDNVGYDPWTGAKLEGAKSETLDGPGTLENTSTGGDVTIDASGEHTIIIAKYEDNPGSTPTFVSSGNYYDVHLDNDDGVTSLTTEFCPADEDTVIYYWDGSSWRRASNQSYSDGCILVTITPFTSPDLLDLAGLPFALGTRYPPAVGGEVYPVSKLAVLTPWLSLVLIIVIGGSILGMRRRTSR